MSTIRFLLFALRHPILVVDALVDWRHEASF